MIIAKLINNNVVISADQSVQVTDAGVFGHGWENLHFAGKVVVEEVDTLPNGYVDNAWSYINGVWLSVLQSAVDANATSTAALVRSRRNSQLTSSDWTQVIDAPVEQAAWATYRQALRGITTQAGFPWTIDWPVAP